jgi:hypothetical protein
MTSDEIQSHRAVYSADSDPPCNGDSTDLAYSQVCWLKELAYQLAVMNERNASGDQQAVDEMLKKVGLGSPVRAASETEVRGDGENKSDLDRWTMPDWICKCGYRNNAIRSRCRNFYCRSPRPADERTTPPNPQTSSIQS